MKKISFLKRTEYIMWTWTWALDSFYSLRRLRSSSSLDHRSTWHCLQLLSGHWGQLPFWPKSDPTRPWGEPRACPGTHCEGPESSPCFPSTSAADYSLRLLPRPYWLLRADVCRWPAIANAPPWIKFIRGLSDHLSVLKGEDRAPGPEHSKIWGLSLDLLAHECSRF